MHTGYTNLYKTARSRAGLTQERAAEVLHLSVESVKAYETGVRTPPDQTVRLMADAYGAPELALEHARETDELGLIPRGAAPQPLPLAAMRIYNRMIRFAEQHRGQQLLQIAEDGVIDETERPILEEIVAELEEISAAYLALRCARQKKENASIGWDRDVRTTENPRTQEQLSDHHYSTSHEIRNTSREKSANFPARKAVEA